MEYDIEEEKESMWERLELPVYAYSSDIDWAMIAVIKGMMSEEKYSTDIANKFNLDLTLVCLLKEMLCCTSTKDYGLENERFNEIAEYGSSPRGAWLNHSMDQDAFLNDWLEDYKAKWGEDWAMPCQENN